MITSRRTFLKSAAVVASVSPLHAQDTSSSEWGGPVVDCHHHLRRTLEANLLHLDGAGLSGAVVLARENSADQIGATKATLFKCEPGHHAMKKCLIAAIQRNPYRSVYAVGNRRCSSLKRELSEDTSSRGARWAKAIVSCINALSRKRS